MLILFCELLRTKNESALRWFPVNLLSTFICKIKESWQFKGTVEQKVGGEKKEKVEKGEDASSKGSHRCGRWQCSGRSAQSRRTAWIHINWVVFSLLEHIWVGDSPQRTYVHVCVLLCDTWVRLGDMLAKFFILFYLRFLRLGLSLSLKLTILARTG